MLVIPAERLKLVQAGLGKNKPPDQVRRFETKGSWIQRGFSRGRMISGLIR
jgi:hypothetical protein